MSLLHHDVWHEALDFTSHFREDFYASLTRRDDTLSELTDAMLCENGPVTSPADLTLLAEHRCGHGALYDALNHGCIDVARLRRALAVLPQPKAADTGSSSRSTSATDCARTVLGRMRSDRVMRKSVPATWTQPRQGGRPPKHGAEFRFAGPGTWGEPDQATVQVTDRYGTARAMAWDRLHPKLTTRCAWIGHEGELPVVEGTVIRLDVDHLPGGQDPLPVWLWSSKTGMTSSDVDLRWQAFLRRFDLEHTFRMIRQTLGWTRPKLRTPQAADRWTWLVIAAHTQLRLTREAAAGLRRPWEKPAEPGRLTPASSPPSTTRPGRYGPRTSAKPSATNCRRRTSKAPVPS